MQKKRLPSRVAWQRIWLGVFGLWVIFLSGIFSGLFGGPGVLQAVRLQNLLHAKSDEMNQLKTRLTDLQVQSDRLEKDPVTQRYEIKKVLGYVAPDEIIFDFNHDL